MASGLFSKCVGFCSAWHPFQGLHCITEEKWRPHNSKPPSPEVPVRGTRTRSGRLKSRNHDSLETAVAGLCMEGKFTEASG